MMPRLTLPRSLRQVLPAAPPFYLVGGAVRDLLMERRPTDLDMVVKGNAAAFAATLAARLGARTVTIGKAGFVTHRIAARGLLIDITSMDERALDDDLQRRDFTINAMAYDPTSDQLIDPLNGCSDIIHRQIRMISEQAFVDDPLRLLRAFRIAAVSGFAIAPETLAAIVRHAHRIGQPAGERLHHELFQLLACPTSAVQIESMSDSSLLVHLLPEMAPLKDCGQNEHHDYDVYRHTLKAYAGLETTLGQADDLPAVLTKRYQQTASRRQSLAVLKYALLLHDIGKPGTRRVHDDGTVHFHGHARRSLAMAEAVHQRLRLSGVERAQARGIIANHGRPMDLLAAHKAGTLTRRGINRFYRDCGPWVPDVLLHALGDTLGKKATPDAAVGTTLTFIRNIIDDFFHRFCPLANRRPLLGGRDLMARFGLAPSSLIGKVLAAVEEERLAGRIATRDEAFDLAASFLTATPHKSRPQ